jgi:hypothetical protein
MKWILGLVTWLAVSNLAQPQADATAELVFYREKEFLGKSFLLSVNGQKVTNWSPGRYFRLQVPPGKLQVSTLNDNFFVGAPLGTPRWEITPQVLDLEAQPGQVYYIKGYQMVDIFTNELHLKQVDASKAQREMKGLKLDKDAKTSL